MASLRGRGKALPGVGSARMPLPVPFRLGERHAEPSTRASPAVPRARAAASLSRAKAPPSKLSRRRGKGVWRSGFAVVKGEPAAPPPRGSACGLNLRHPMSSQETHVSIPFIHQLGARVEGTPRTRRTDRMEVTQERAGDAMENRRGGKFEEGNETHSRRLRENPQQGKQYSASSLPSRDPSSDGPCPHTGSRHSFQTEMAREGTRGLSRISTSALALALLSSVSSCSLARSACLHRAAASSALRSASCSLALALSAASCAATAWFPAASASLLRSAASLYASAAACSASFTLLAAAAAAASAALTRSCNEAFSSSSSRWILCTAALTALLKTRARLSLSLFSCSLWPSASARCTRSASAAQRALCASACASLLSRSASSRISFASLLDASAASSCSLVPARSCRAFSAALRASSNSECSLSRSSAASPPSAFHLSASA
mmetsp:Transcript_36369/g.86344  ORF Transcript_36369/g.86344 Transcript_36369/m.86344 type:complete len:439 (-) Transcript_36369:1594-2910(-)